MSEFIRQFKAAWPRVLFLFLPAVFLLFVVLLSILLTPDQPEPSLVKAAPTAPAPPPSPSLLVTAEQMAQLTYTDSTMGVLRWDISEDSLLELNRTLIKYGILTSEEICHFLAQVTVETGAGRELTELGDEEYFQSHGFTTGTRGAGYLHLTYDYGQMAFATWMMKRYVSALADITFVSPASNSAEQVAAAYYSALQTAANLGLNISRYSRIVYDPNCDTVTGADYIAENFAWESAGYYWSIAGISEALASNSDPISSSERIDTVSALVGGANWQSRREAYQAFAPILMGS